MKAESLYHTGVVVDDLEKTMNWLADVAGYTWTEVVSVDQDAVTPDGEVTIPMKMAYSGPTPGSNCSRPFPVPSGLPPTPVCTTSATGPMTSKAIWRLWNPMA